MTAFKYSLRNMLHLYALVLKNENDRPSIVTYWYFKHLHNLLMISDFEIRKSYKCALRILIETKCFYILCEPL